MCAQMKIIFLFCFLPIVYCVVPVACSAQPITFEKWYDYGFGERGNCVQQTSDEGYIIAGMQGIAIGVSRNLLIKTDSLGNVMWVKIFGGAYDNTLYSVKQTFDGGYIMTGITTNITYKSFISLIKTNNTGDTTWTKTFFPPLIEAGGWDVCQTADSGFVILASIDSSIVFIKTDTNGDTLWMKKYTPQLPAGGYCKSLKQTSDGGFIAVGRVTLTYPNPTFGVYLIKTNSNGDTLWTKIIRDTVSNNVGAYHVSATSDGGFFIAGGRYIIGDLRMYLVRTDSSGDTLWTKIIPDSDARGGGLELINGEYVAAGIADNFSLSATEVYLIKMDSGGNLLWQKTFGTSVQGEDSEARWTIQTSDGGFAIAGYRYYDAYLIKTDSAGNVLTAVDESAEGEPSLLVYPNPFSEQALILLPKKIREHKEKGYAITDLLGRTVRREKIMQQDNMIIFLRDNLLPGVYLLQIFSKEEILGSAKIVIQ